MLIKLAIWYLKHKKVTAIINCKINNGEIHQKTNRGETHNSDFNNTRLYLSNGKELRIPEGKFSIKQAF